MSPSRPRRDPRAERAARTVAPARSGRTRLDLAAKAAAPASGPGGRPRRDPRADLERARVAGAARPRFDRGHRGSAAPLSLATAAEAAAAPRIRTVAAPAFLVGAVVETAAGRSTPHARQLLGAARLLADGGADGEGAVVALRIGASEDLGAAGADRLLDLSAALDETGPEAADAYDPEGLAAAVAAAARRLGLRHLLFAETVDGGDLARRVAAKLGEPLFAGVESLTARLVTRAAKARSVERRAAPPRLIALMPDAVAPHGGPAHALLPLDASDAGIAPSPGVARGIGEARRIAADPASVSLSEADFVISAGNGISDFAAFRALVAALGATPGASRVVCDAGLMPRAAQVGASGTVLDARCYFALGIAGAPQHLQGVAGCEHVVAVNTDLHAAMIERAGLAIVADAQKVMPALLEALAEAAREAPDGAGGAASGRSAGASAPPVAAAGGAA